MPLPTDYATFLNGFQSSKFKALLPAQAYVLGQYAASFANEPDLAIQLPTGAGKTLIALLIAEAWRREGKSAAILSANKTLARQMEREAVALGMPAVLMEGSGLDIPAATKRAFQRRSAVAVMNYWVYFNQNPVIDPADLLIMDDAHLAEHCLHSLYSLEINRVRHEELFATLATELATRFPEYPALVDAASSDKSGRVGDTSAELLSFISQAEIGSRLIEIIESSPALQNDKDLRFRWKRLRNHVGDFNFYVSGSAIWLRPYVYPLSTTQHYAQVQQAIYLSATIGDPSDLRRRLGGRAIKSMPVPKEHTEVTSGRRLVVMNRVADEENITPRMATLLLTALKIHPKSLWLCSSEADATRVRTIVTEWLNKNGLVNHPSWLLTPLGDEIDQFKSSPTGHLFVAGRFDGMDFNGDQCRLVILLTLPKAINLQEEFITSYLRDSEFMRRRLNQRIVQALGRCNRSENDYALYLLADQRFPNHFGRDTNLVGLPSNIIAELDMAQDLADADEAQLVGLVSKFMSGDFSDYDSLAKNYAPLPLSGKPQIVADTSDDEVQGWNALYPSQNYGLAADHFEHCWDKMRQSDYTEIGALYGWQWAKTLYSQHMQGDPSARGKFIDVLQDALGKGQKSSWFNRQRAALNKYLAGAAAASEALQEEYPNAVLRAFDAFLEKTGSKGEKFQKECDKISSKLASDDHNLFQDGLVALGELLGYAANKPKYSAATDCRWRGVFGGTREIFTFEAKIEHKETGAISATDIGQAHNQRARAEHEVSNQGFVVHGTLATHLKSFHPGAQGSLGAIRVIEKDALCDLWTVVQGILVKYRGHWSLDNISARLVAAEGVKSQLPKAGWFSRALESSEDFVGSPALLAEWKAAGAGGSSPN